MREQLLGYLVGALDAAEQEAVEQALENDTVLRADLDRLAASVEPLRCDRAEDDPPAGLAARACQFVADYIECEEPATAPPASVQPVRHREPLAAGEPGSGRWTLLDLIVTAGVCAAAAMLFFPAISHSRQASQLAVCQHNLAKLGQALIRSSEMAKDHSFPQVPAEGNEAAAGIYAVKLWEQGFISDPSYFVCPGSNWIDAEAPFEPVTLARLRSAVGQELHHLRQRMGGSYGYHLGCVIDGELRPTRNRGRSTFALMADAPAFVDAEPVSFNHGRCGQNVLFEDGSVRYLVKCKREGCGDVIFLNDRNEISAGLHENDAVVAPSAAAPLRAVTIGLGR